MLLDGTPICIASNDGQGGCDRHQPVKSEDYRQCRARIEEANVFLATLEGWKLRDEPDTVARPHDIESAVGELLATYLDERDLARSLRSALLFTRSDKPGLYRVPKLTDPKEIGYWQERFTAKNPGVSIQVLNTLPKDAALAAYRRGAQ